MSDDQPTLTTSSQGGFNFTSTHPIGEVKFHDDQPKPAETESAPKENTPEGDSEKDPHAVALGKKGAEALAAKRAAEKEAAEVPEGDEGDEAKRKASADIEGAPPEQKKKLASDRVAEATRAAAEAKRELARERADRERLAKENSELRAKQPKPAEQEPEADGNQKPKEEDFEKYADFVEALADWKADERLRREFSARERQESVRRQATEYVQTVDTHVKTYAQRMSEAMKADAGFSERLSPEISDLRPTFMLGEEESPDQSNLIADEIIASEYPAQVSLYLSEHSDTFQRIASLRTPRDIAREMAKLEDRVSSGLERATAGTPPPKPKEVSKAPAPVRPVTGAPAIAEATYRPGESFEDYYRRNNPVVRERIFGR